MSEAVALRSPSRALAGAETNEALWRSLAYFNFYRLAVASVFLVGGMIYGDVADGSRNVALFARVAAAYWVVAVAFVLSGRRRWLAFDHLLTLQVSVDTAALTLLMFASGGHRSGLAIMLIVVLAGAGLVGQGRLTLLYAAMATLAVLGEQAYRILHFNVDVSEFLSVGIISIGFFATAISARLLAQRVIANQELARQRGIDLDNQLRLNERIIRDMQDGVLVVEPGGHVVQMNPQAKALLGERIAASSSLAEASPALAERLQQFIAHDAEAIAYLRGDAQAASVRARFVRPADGGAVLVYLEDMGRIQAQAQQIKLAALGRLTASIAHEIRNPLAAISHAAELLREEKRGDMLGRLSRIVQDNTRRIDRMVREILELGRRDRAEPENLPLGPFLETFLDEFCLHGETPRGTFVCEVEPGATLIFDRAHLNQVLWNLLRNSLRYCSRREGAVRLSASQRASANRVELHIIDDGPGIAEEARARLFEPFFTTHPQGTGLGLYIARELCEANRAALELLDDAPGAHFCIRGMARE